MLILTAVVIGETEINRNNQSQEWKNQYRQLTRKENIRKK